MKEQQLRKKIKQILSEQRIMTLSLCDAEGSWAAPVFFASDGFILYFVSNPKSRHGRAAMENRLQAAAIFDSSSEWRKIQGLQTNGRIEIPESPEEIEKAKRFYVKKFPFTGIFFKQKDILPPPLAAKITDVRFFMYRPSRIVLVDNNVHFGFHAELKLD